MPENPPDPVKQCVADPAFDWLRACLQGRRVELNPQQIEMLEQHGLSALVHALLNAHNVAAVPELAASARRLAMRELAHQQALAQLATACADAVLDVLLIKGEAVARTMYQAGTRSRSDIDLWVRADQVDALRAVLVALGYPSVRAIRQRWARFELVHGGGSAAEIGFDIHIHPFFRPRMLAQRDFAAVWSDAIAIADLPRLRLPCAFDGFLIAALHLAKNRHKRWIWLHDIDLYCRREPEAVQRACSMAGEWRIAALIADALTRSVAAFDTPLPCELPVPIHREPLAQMLEPVNRWAALRRDIAALPDIAARLQFVRELLLRRV
jgi:hypothetical protein